MVTRMVRKLPLSAPQTPTADGSVASDAVRKSVLKRGSDRVLRVELCDQSLERGIAVALGGDVEPLDDAAATGRRVRVSSVGIGDQLLGRATRAAASPNSSPPPSP